MGFNGLFNGHMVSYNAAIVRVAGFKSFGFTEWSLSDELTTAPEYGNSPLALGAPIGQHKADGSCKQHKTEADVLAAALNNASGGAGFGFAFANVFLDFVAPGVPRTKIEADNVRLIKRANSFSNDGKGIVDEWTLLVTEPIKWNGIYIINPARFGGAGGLNIGIGGEVSISLG